MKSYIKRIFIAALCVMMLATMVLPNIPAAKADEPESTQKTLYVFDLEAFINTLPKAGEARYDYLKIATALQGLVNRNEAQLYYLFETNSFAKNNGNVDMDEYWLEKLSEEDEYLASFTQRKDVTDFYQLFTIFEDYYDGIVLWDPDVPATSNVASTVAGADDLLPVRYLTEEGSLWAALQEKNLFADHDVKVNLVDKFADNATNIPDSTTASTGSAKNDAYIWAKEQYLDTGKTSADLMTYTVDAWVKGETNEVLPYASEFISVKMPKVMKAGSSVDIEVTVKNIGTTEWKEIGSASGGFRLGCVGDAYVFANGTNNRIMMDSGVITKTGETYTYKTTLKAPTTSGTWELNMKMANDGGAGGWFGATLSRTIEVVGGSSSSDSSADTAVKAVGMSQYITAGSDTNGYDADIIGASLPAYMVAGSEAEVSVTVKNTGVNSWSENAGGTRLSKQDDNSTPLTFNNTVGDTNVHDRMFVGTTVSANDIYTFTTKLKAPDTAGTYELKLQMIYEAPGVGYRFGDTLVYTIKVVKADNSNVDTSVKAITIADHVAAGDGVDNYDYEFTSVSLPANMLAGSEAEISVTVKNTGTVAWNAEESPWTGGVRLGTENAELTFNNTIGDANNHNRMYLNTTVENGGSYTFTTKLKAPTTAGTYTLDLKLIKEGANITGNAAWFGDKLTYSIEVVEAVDTAVKPVGLSQYITSGNAFENYNFSILAATLPENMVAGSTAEVSVTVKNTGTGSLSDDYSTTAGNKRLGRVDQYEDFAWTDAKNSGYETKNRAFLVKNTEVAAGETYTFNFSITAPSATGEKIFKANMVSEAQAWFGDTLTYTINVVIAPSTSTDEDQKDEDDKYTDKDFEAVYEDVTAAASVMYSDLMNTMLPNADYYIAKKAFFWDLSPDDSIAPIDDRNQKVGTDVQTLNAILASQQKRAEDAVKAGDKTDAVFTVSGFVPWWLKYTTTSDPGHSTMGDVPSEWKMVEIISSYLGQVDADAYGMTSVSNTSVFSKIPLDTREQSGKYDAENVNTDVVYDKDTNYILFYMGDYDASSWTSGCLPLLWDDTERGTRSDVPLAWAVCSDLAQCVPHVFNYLYETASENDYFVAGDNGTGYLDPMKLTDEQLTVWKNHNKTANEKFDIDVQGFLIAGNSGTITEKVQEAYNEMTPVGVVYQGGVNKDIYEGVPYVAYYDIGNQIKSSSAASVANTIKSNMAATGQFHVYRSILTSPSAIYDIVDELNKTDAKFKILDPYTFFKLYADSDGGTKSVAPITYEAPKASEITVDGEIKDAEWADAKEIKISVASDDVKKYGTNWNVSSDDTVSANFKLKWDSQYLYIAQTITDEALLPMTDTSKMNYLSNDATMLFLDMNGSRVGSTYLAGDYAVYYAFDSDYEPVVFLRSAPGGATTEVKLSSSQYQAKFTFNADKTSATMELALPWSLFQDVTFTPEEGKSVGMTVMIIDHDVTTDNGGRQIMWCGAGDEQSGWAGMKLVAGTVTVDKTALKAAIEAAEAIDLSKYQNGAEKDAFEEALAAAKTVYAKEDATQTEVDNATTALTKAQGGLKPKNSSGSIPTVKPTVSNNTKHPFTDVSSSDWYNDDVQYVYEKGLMDGISGKEFAPNATVTRAMVATILWRMEGEPAASYGTDFTDVEKNQWYSEAIAWTAHNGIFGGYGNGLFGTNDPITREQLATILYRYAQYQGRSMSVSGKLSAFADGAQVSAYAMDAMQWCVGSGLLNGADGKLNPTGTATRAELAAILHRFTK